MKRLLVLALLSTALFAASVTPSAFDYTKPIKAGNATLYIAVVDPGMLPPTAGSVPPLGEYLTVWCYIQNPEAKSYLVILNHNYSRPVVVDAAFGNVLVGVQHLSDPTIVSAEVFASVPVEMK